MLQCCKNVKIGLDNGRLKQKRPKAILNESDIFVEKVEMNHLKAAPLSEGDRKMNHKPLVYT